MFLANDEAAASAGFNDDLLVQPHTPAKCHRAGAVIHLVNQHTIANKDMWPEV